MNRKILFSLAAVLAVCAVSVVAHASGLSHALGGVVDPSLIGLAVVGGLATVSDDHSGKPGSPELLNGEFVRQLKLDYYLRRNGVISTTIATLPALTLGSNKAKLKTTNATVLKNAGVANALGASDDAFVLTGANLAIGSFRRYLCLVDSADAKTVLASSDAATAALCAFPYLPADGLAIVGIVTITSTALFIPATTELDAAGVTATYKDGDQDDAVFALGGRIIS